MPYKKKFYKKSQIKKSIIKKCNKKNYWSIQGTLFVYNTVVYNLCFNLSKMLKKFSGIFSNCTRRHQPKNILVDFSEFGSKIRNKQLFD